MNGTAYLFIFGTFALVVSAIVGGAWLHNGYGAALLVAGVIGGVAWFAMMLQISSAMNSDI